MAANCINSKEEFDDKEFRKQLYKIAGGPIHQKARSRVIQSHLRHVATSFSNFEASTFIQFVVDKYVEARTNNKKFSGAYIKTVIETINRHHGISTFSPSDVYKITSNLNKAFNPENKDSVFYTPDGNRIDLCRAKQLNIEQKVLFDRKFADKLYDEDDFEEILAHYKQHLDNYLDSTVKVANINDELSLLIVFLASAPRRVSEVLNLTLAKASDLVIRQETEIKSKSGTRVISLIIPNQLSNILDRYISKIEGIHVPDMRLFLYNYKSMYDAYRRNYRALFNREPISRVFHAFRNHFAGKYYERDAEGTRNALSHSSLTTTKLYANKQKSKFTNRDTHKFLTQNYPYAPPPFDSPKFSKTI